MNELVKSLLAQAHLEKHPDTNEVAARFAELIAKEVMEMCDIEKADYFKNRKGAYDFNEKNIYAEGEAACDTLKYKVKHRFGVGK